MISNAANMLKTLKQFSCSSTKHITLNFQQNNFITHAIENNTPYLKMDED